MAAVRRKVSILGATGSVGKSTLDLIERSPDRFEMVALTAASNVTALAQAAKRTNARLAVVADEARLGELEQALSGTACRAAAGRDALIEAAAAEADLVMAAIVGCAGLEPVMAAVEAGRTLALANKEALVTAGSLMTEAATAAGATILPVDSEHNAIFQCLAGNRLDDVARLVLTASGGPFRSKGAEEMARATPEQAVAHPNWSMGAKISVDSATMMNKGLELIEAAHLFPVPEERIEVLVHPQSAVHGLVQYADGSILAQLGTPDMRTPIAHALAWPDRMAVSLPRLDLAALGRLDFLPPDPARFPALRLSRDALRAGAGAPVVLNAANEVAVALFLERRLGFLDIAAVVEEALDLLGAPPVRGLDDVLALDAQARHEAARMAARHAAA